MLCRQSSHAQQRALTISRNPADKSSAAAESKASSPPGKRSRHRMAAERSCRYCSGRSSAAAVKTIKRASPPPQGIPFCARATYIAARESPFTRACGTAIPRPTQVGSLSSRNKAAASTTELSAPSCTASSWASSFTTSAEDIVSGNSSALTITNGD